MVLFEAAVINGILNEKKDQKIKAHQFRRKNKCIKNGTGGVKGSFVLTF